MTANNSPYHSLKDKWLKKHKELQKNLWDKHEDALEEFINNSKHLAIGTLSGIMLLTSPIAGLLPTPGVHAKEAAFPIKLDKNIFLVSDLANILPNEVRPLTNTEEATISALLSNRFGLKVSPELDGKRLNRSYGFIGAEQHLARFPGDNMNTHFDTDNEALSFTSSGMAPGLGAWGYFAPSYDNLKPEDKLKEKYYIAAQTFLAPGFNENVRDFITFFKYRKMLIVNPSNGKAMVVVIGDAGPAEWTGKHLGGSPEVMKYLERVDGAQKGAVLYFFIDDHENKVPLGPIETK